MPWLPPRTRQVALLASALLLVSIAGCGGNSTVTGKVTFKGRPVTYGSVVFLSADHTARSGVIQPDGAYTVENVAPGAVLIAVISPDPTKGKHHAGEGDADAKKAKQTWFALPPKYEDPTKSGITCTVTSGSSRYDIDLQ